MSDEVPSLRDRLDTSRPHSARVWNYLLGGKDNFAADRAAAEDVTTHLPEIVEIARAGRAFLMRAIWYLTVEAGIRQFLDLGTGLPTANNTHEVAQRFAPESRIVYVDNDPLVLVHARALLTSAPEGVTAYIDADVRNTEDVLREARQTLDFGKPIAVMMLGILGHIPDDAQASGIVARIVDEIPSGSYLVVNDSIDTPANAAAIAIARRNGADYHLRTPDQLTAFFTGLELVGPGVVSTPRWQADTDAPELDVSCGVARKP
jgi:O-methyltransferase involved in polyketide biosynthesis